MNKGDGTFQNPVDYAITGEVQALAVADLNGDGKLDLVVPTGGYPSGVSVLLGMGDGTFASPVMYTSTLLSFYSASVAVADFNGDGKLDLALANSTPNNAVAILLGNGDGTFQNPPLLYSAGLDPDGVLALDVNRDGKPDLAVVGGYGVASYYSVTVLINQGDGTFPHATAYPALKYPWTAVVGDFNGDGKPDIAVASVTTTSTGQDNGGAVSVFLGNGDGTFEPRLDSPTSNFPFVIAPGDFNGDGKLDLVVVEGTPYGELLSTWIGNGDGTFQNNISQSLPNYARSLAVGDFNHDGKLDVAATVDYAGAVYVFLGNGDGTFTSPLSYATGAGTNYSGYNVIAADFNGDGNLDLAVTTDQGISILLGKGDGTFRPYTAILPGESLLAVGDFNGDGKPDLAIATGNNIISVALGNGDGTFQQASGYQITSILEFGSPTVGDFNGDGKLDIAFTSQYTGVVTILFGNGDGTFSRHMEFGTAQVPAIVAADFNGDGALDLAMTDVTNQQVSVLLSSAVAALYPSHLNFTSQLDGTPSPEQTVSMSNPSPVPISFSSIGTTGDFSEANNCDSKLMAGANCQVSVTFAPTADGIRSGMLIFNDNAADSPQTVSLSGTGVAVSLSTMSLSFGAQLVGSSSRETVTLTNLGSTPLSISSLSLVSLAPVTSLGTKAGDFAIQSSSCVAGGSVAALGSCTINVAFKPTAAGIQSATLVIRDSDPTSPQSVNLRGTGTAVRLSPTSLGFAPQPVDTTSVPRTVTLANLGNTPLRIESLTLGGTDAGDFAIQSNSTCAAGATVAGEGSCTINLAFKPSAAGARSATLVISDSDPGSPQTVSLSGRGR
jgi:hypothetical protein